MADKSTAIQPLGMRVLVAPEESGDVTQGGLIIPPSANEDNRPEIGIVKRLGTGKKNKEFKVKEGDKVFFKKYSPDEIEVDGTKYYVLDQDDILAILA